MRRLRRGKKSLRVRHHKRTARSHVRRARMWEFAGESDLARLHWSRATIHCRAAEIKPDPSQQNERRTS
jgi:hypothetical protein